MTSIFVSVEILKCSYVLGLLQWARDFYKNNKKFWEELIAHFPFIRHGPHRKQKIKEETQTTR
jgi:hypothetical protein